MAYVPKDWVTGEVITESALDHIEQGIANAGGVVFLPVTSGPTGHVLGKTYNEIKAMIQAGQCPAIALLKSGNDVNDPFLDEEYLVYYFTCMGHADASQLPEGSPTYIVSFQTAVTLSGNITEKDFAAADATSALVDSNGGGQPA